MPKYDFDILNDRRIPGDVKYQSINGLSDFIPMWVADMDFKTAPCVENAFNQVARHGIYGYQNVDDEYIESVRTWYSRRFSCEIQNEWILPSPAVMYSAACSIRALTKEGDSVLIFEPVYYPFAKVIKNNRRRLIISELKQTEGYYEIDYEDFESKIKENNVKAILFCSPHNPVGRVWTKKELKHLCEICLRHHVYIISDEIHADLVYRPCRHVPIASLSDEAAAVTVTCSAPTKTFNLASVQVSNMIIPNEHIRKSVQREMLANCQYGVNAFGIAATKAVYTEGEAWLDELLCYLDESHTILAEAFPQDSPISVLKPEGTYLAWLDCRGLGLSDNMLYNRFLLDAGVRLHKGVTFGKAGSGYMRLNFACPHSVLKDAVGRIQKTFL